MSFSGAPHFSATAGASDDDAGRAADPLRGRRILIVEDDPYITVALEEMLAEEGLIIAGAARNIETALRLARSEPLDLALLDVNIGPDKIDPVADALAERGCPFVFTTGCGRAGLPEAYLDRAIVEKPFYVEEILKSLRDELSGNSVKG